MQAPLHGLCITHGVFISFFLINNHVYLRPWQWELQHSTAQHNTVQYSTGPVSHSIFYTQEGFSLQGFFYCDRVDSQGNLYGGFLVFWRGRGGWGYVYMNIWRLIDIRVTFEVEGLGNLT